MHNSDDLNKQMSLDEYFMYKNVINSADESLLILNIVTDFKCTMMFSDFNLTLVKYAENEVKKVKKLMCQ